MKKNLKKLLDAINARKAKIKTLVENDQLDEAEAEKKLLAADQKKFNLLYDLDEDANGDGDDGDGDGVPGAVKPAGAGDPDGDPVAPTAKQVGNALVAAIRARLKGKKAPAEAAAILKRDAELRAEMVEGTPGEDEGEDGGLTVPQDISTQINELRRAAADNLENYVNVENVSTKTGSRVIEIDADSTEWPEIEEGDDFQEQDTPKLKTISYKIKKFGGILKVTAELLEDTAENILAYLKKWIAKKSRATRNAKILAAMKTCVGDTSYAIESIDDLKDIFNIVLDPAIAQGAAVYTNQTGFNFLDKLKDKDGNYIIQPDPTQKTKKLLFGEYPIIKLSNKVLKNETGDNATVVPVYCGDLKEAVTLFDRKVISLDISTTAGDLWVKDKTGLKVRDRFDVQPVDTAAVVLGKITIATAG
ncbi:MAG: phage major capsid protein [Oscillospiraceae bacterium]|nr:phage major capsid protein [Oscillospiraceae bacterium]